MFGLDSSLHHLRPIPPPTATHALKVTGQHTASSCDQLVFGRPARPPSSCSSPPSLASLSLPWSPDTWLTSSAEHHSWVIELPPNPYKTSHAVTSSEQVFKAWTRAKRSIRLPVRVASKWPRSFEVKELCVLLFNLQLLFSTSGSVSVSLWKLPLVSYRETTGS